jgi:predicted dehydrogenase
MGISHLSILGAHPQVEIAGVCDASKLVVDALSRYTPFPCFTDHRTMLEKTKPDAVVIAVPTRFHAALTEEMLERKLHVFVEKPFCLQPEESDRLAKLADRYQLVNQVGYHNKFIGTFNEVKRLAEGGWIGDVYHFHAQAYGPVVVRARQRSWRTAPQEGGGCLMDYASHAIDLVNYLIAPVSEVRSSSLKKVFSQEVEDAVYAMLVLENGVSGMLSVNWSDETYRKMSTSISINGTKGKIVSDANECKVYFKEKEVPEGYTRGWNIRYVTDLTPNVDFYLRGEEYSLQIDHFIDTIMGQREAGTNSFHSAALTDHAIQMIRNEQF